MSLALSEVDHNHEERFTLPSPLIEDMDDTNRDCFDVECAIEAIGSSARAMQAIISRLQKTPNLVTVYAKFTNVPPDIAKTKLSKGCRQMYDSDSRCMIVTVPGKPHGTAAGNFQAELILAARSANLARLFSCPLIARVEGTSRSKEPDGSWIPVNPPPRRGKTWPTIILEVGVSESKKKLRNDAAWWLANSEGLVNVVITVSINQALPEITFESIVLERPILAFRHGRPRYVPITRQSIVIRRPGGPNQPITSVPNTSPLMISCEELLCRPPIPPETDPNIPITSLEWIASLVWDEQGL